MPDTTPYSDHWPTHRDIPPHGPITNEHPEGSGYWNRPTPTDYPEWIPTATHHEAGWNGGEEYAKEEFRVLYSTSGFAANGTLKHLTQHEAAKMHYGLAHNWPTS